MPILLKTASGSALVKATEFANETELQTVLAECPTLLCRPDDAPLALVKREVELGEAGWLDILFVNAEGLPVAVEVKLARNGESRREIVAQIIDYVSSLTQLTAFELDSSVDGAVERALRSLAEGDDQRDFDKLWEQVGTNLRAGLARVVLALDEAPPELERIVRFLAERSNLDIRLVTLSRYGSDSNTYYVPSFVIDASEQRPTPSGTSPRSTPAELLAAAAAYDEVASAELKSKGQATYYRLIRPPEWPAGVHYEFYMTSGQIGTELHLESDRVRSLRSVLEPMDGKVLRGNQRLVWDPKWTQRGRLMVKHPIDADPRSVADAMVALIEATKGPVSRALEAPAVAS